MEEQQGEPHGERRFDKKEIRGLTGELILKYIGVLGALFLAYGDIKSGQKSTLEKVTEQGKQIEILKTDIQALKSTKETNEIWKARLEEKLKNYDTDKKTK